MITLMKKTNYAGPKGSVVLVIMDGVDEGKHDEGDMAFNAVTPNLDLLKKTAISLTVAAHGTAVGLPDDGDMGNSEVGHNAIGCGRVFAQGAALVNKDLDSGAMYAGETWNNAVKNVKDNGSTFHFIGLISDGNVHSNIAHLESMLTEAKANGVTKARVHALIDGRDVPPTSALEYVSRLEAKIAELNADGSVDFCIASGGGRMQLTMDRYDADWSMIERGWNTHVRGEGRMFASTTEAVETFRAEKDGILDQDLPGFVIERDGAPVGQIVDGDSVILCNYRGDRALEITKAFEAEELSEFARGPKLDVFYAGMMQYDGDLAVPKNFLVCPPAIDCTMSEYLSNSRVSQFAISETQKFGHMTYFFNGNNSKKFATETYMEIPSDNCPFENAPRMKADEITAAVSDAMTSGDYKFIRLNYPNGDMVGHTGNMAAVKLSVEAVDEGIGKLMAVAQETGSILVISADHGNSDNMVEIDKKTGEPKRDAKGVFKMRTAHSLNPVPVIVYDPSNAAHAALSSVSAPGVSNLAATCIELLGFDAPVNYTPSLVTVG